MPQLMGGRRLVGVKGDSNAAIDNRAGGVSEITFEDC
jgi:hypothetical protein